MGVHNLTMTAADREDQRDWLGIPVTLRDTLCGDTASAALALFGASLLAFCFLIALPFALHAQRILAAARSAGGCASCAPAAPQVVVVPRGVVHGAVPGVVPGVVTQGVRP